MDTPIVTLTTDWGDRDFFAGRVKGKLMSYIPGVQVVDITHGIDPFRVEQAAFVVKNACLEFPKGTIHIIDVNSSETPDRPFVAIAYHGQYYLCTDNGLPDYVFGNGYSEAVLIDVPRETNFFTFAACDLFCRVAAMIAQGKALSEIGTEADELTRITPLNPVEEGGRMKLIVNYIDNYGNAYLNITYDEFERMRNNRPFEMMVRDTFIKEISMSYLDVKSKTILLTVSSTGQLQIAVSQGNAEQLFGIQLHDAIYVRFF